MENQYNKGHAKEILEPCGLLGDYLKIKKSGVWPAFKVNKLVKAETEALRWRPAKQLKDLPGAPEVKGTPMLPNPFNARELAAFMLEGVGGLVAGFYGAWSDGPNQERLDHIDPDSNARRAVIEAYAAYREAERVVGAYPSELAAVADRARKAYNIANTEANLREGVSDSIPGTEDSRVRRERAKSSIAVLDSEMEATKKAAQIASETWLTAMVRELLVEHKPQATTKAPAPAQTATAPAPVVAESNTQAWTVSKPQRGGAYRTPLHRLITAAYLDGGPRPTARDVVEAWRINKPAEVAQVLPDGFDYYDAQGNTKHADLEAVRKAIDRMTSAR